MAGEGMQARGIPAHGKSIYKRIQDFVTQMGCHRRDDVVTGAYNMPEARSARPSAAPSSRPNEARTNYSRRWGRVRILQRHCHDMTHIFHYIALLRCSFVRGRHPRNMTRAWIRCPSRLFSQTQLRTQDMAHTPKTRDLSCISPREGSPCLRRLVSQR
jgi:hypothetical protein